MAAKILIVEDNADQREFLEMLLRLEGYVIDTATDGGEAIERARAQQPDLIISDIRMPDIDGIELVRRLREMPGFGQVPVLVLSGDSSGDLRVARKAGANQALRKPVEVDELINTVKGMVG